MAKIKIKSTNINPAGSEDEVSLFNLMLVALSSGATTDTSGDDVVYTVANHRLSTDHANFITSIEGNSITDYSIQRYIAVSDLSSDLPVELPNSVVSVEGGEPRQLRWDEVNFKPDDNPTVVTHPINGIYYMDVTAHDQHRGLTLDEFNACAGLTLLTADELPTPAPVDEP